MDKLSYALGLNLAISLKQSKITKIADYAAFAQGVEAMLEDKEPAIPINEAQEVLTDFFATLDAEGKKEAMVNKEEGDKFLAENAKRDGVTKLPSGLQYEVLETGAGSIPAASDTVKVHYHGTLINGDVFDSSVSRGEPAQFGVTQVIQGWVEALQLMNVGSKWRLYIPSELAYGERGAGSIAPHSALIFDVELIDIL